MHGDSILLTTFVLALVAAFAGGMAARAVRLPPIVGYLLGGLAVGPFTPGFIGDSHAMNQLAEIGIMFMMFGTGLHFSFDDLKAVKNVAVPGAALQIVLGTAAGCALALALGWSVEAGVILGLSVSIASTVVLIKNLSDTGLDKTEGGRIATGRLIIEDLVTVVIIVVLPVVFGPGETTVRAVAVGLARALLKTAAFVLIMFEIGSRVLPTLLTRIARFCPRELFQLAVIVVALGTAMVAAVTFDLSFALGAFLAGVVVGGSKIAHRVAAESIPFQDLFSIIFFASVGMMVNPGFLMAHLPELLVLVLLIMVGKWVINMALGLALSAGVSASIVIAAGLSQIGEFSFLIGQTGMALGVLNSDQYGLILGAAVVSIALNSFVFKLNPLLERWFAAHPSLASLYERRASQRAVFGYSGAGTGVAPVAAASAAVPANAPVNVPAQAAMAPATSDAPVGEFVPEPAFGALDELFGALPGVELHWVAVRAHSAAAGSTLAELNVRAKTGARAIAMHRDGDLELAIEPDMPLCVDDRLGLLGSPEQIRAAEELLR